MTPPPILFEIFSDTNTSGVAFKNKSLKRGIINLLDEMGPLTLADLSREFNISTPKITTLINEMMQEELIRDYGKIESTGGRPASMYGLVAEAGYFVGVDVKQHSINFGLLDFKKNLVLIKENVGYHLENTTEALDQLIRLIETFLSETSVDRSKILGVCINLSGRINHRSGYSYSYFHFQEKPLTEIIEEHIGIRTFLENDSRAMAYGEFRCGSVSNEKNVLYVYLDYGIGLGILIEGEVYYGKSGFSGEFGHIPFFQNELICHCGKKGCLETEASGQALVRRFKAALQSGSSSILTKQFENIDDIKLQHIIQAAKQEDNLAIELLAELGEKIGKGLAIILNIFNPELMILGGTMASTGEYLRLPIQSALNKYSLSLVNKDTKLIVSKLGEKAGVLGGCLIARKNIMTEKSTEA